VEEICEKEIEEGKKARGGERGRMKGGNRRREWDVFAAAGLSVSVEGERERV